MTTQTPTGAPPLPPAAPPNQPPASPPAPETTPPATPPAGTPPAEPPAAPPEGPKESALTPEQQEALRDSGMKWEAVKGFFKQNEDGSLEFDASKLPQPEPRPEDSPEEIERKNREKDLNHRILAGSSAVADVISKDLSVQQTLAAELAVEPGGDIIMAHAKKVMETVPVSKRTEQSWRNAILLGRGATENKRRSAWIDEGARKAAEDLEKVHKIRIPKPAPAPKTEDQMVDELTAEQKRYCERTGTDPKRYAKRLAELQGGRR